MTSKPKNTRVTIHGMAMLKNRRQLPEKANTYVFDGLFSCAEATNNDKDGIGSFRHYMGRNKRLKPDGTYDIHANVRISTLILLTSQLTINNLTNRSQATIPVETLKARTSQKTPSTF